MKKILLILILFSLTGCVSTGELTNTCTKIEESDELKNTIIYTFNFRNDVIDNVNITNESIGSKCTINSIKLSFETQNNFYKDKLSFNTLVDEENSYKVEYIINMNDVDEDVYNKFNLKKERSKLVKSLENEGYICE